MSETKTTFEEVWSVLSAIDCSKHVEKKNGFKFLSWPWAMGIMMDHYPNHSRYIHKNDNEYPCFFDHKGNGMVRVSVIIDELTRTEDYPVLNFNNKSIIDPPSFEINTSLKRAYVKCLAQYGLGHYLFAGEDLPPEISGSDVQVAVARQAYEKTVKKTAKKPKNEKEPRVTANQLEALSILIEAHKNKEGYLNEILSWGGCDHIKELTQEQAGSLLSASKVKA